MRDVNTIFEDSKTKLDRMAASWDRLKTKAGEAIAVMGAGKAMNWVSDSIQLGLDDADRYQRGETTFGEQNTRTAWNWLTTG